MFEKLIKELKDLQKPNQIFIPLNLDTDGYFDRECPNQECHFQFKVHGEDWKNIFKVEKVFCPMCRQEAESENWWTKQQKNEGKNQAIRQITGFLSKAVIEDAKDFNSRQSSNSFISIHVSVSGAKPLHYVLPIPAIQEMLLKIKCKECSSRYAVIGSAFFCPSCGHNSAEETFDNSINKIEIKLKNLDKIRETIDGMSRDEAEIICRSLIESSLNECVVAFQRFCEVTYSKLNPTEKIKFNAFQKLDVGGVYWKNLYGETYDDWLTQDEFKKLNELFQKRHLLSHTEGIVDQKYVDKSTDNTYIVGQRIVVKENDIIILKDLIKKIVYIIRK